MMPVKRKRLSSAHRLKLACEQQWKCRECEELLPATFEVDHIKPLFSGGTNEMSNLQALCNACHANKSAMERVQFVPVIETTRRCASCDAVHSLYIRHECRKAGADYFEQFRYSK
jgi:5-methylcytosine-specific restriction enzyme A